MAAQLLIAVEDEPSFAACLKLLKRSAADVQKVWPQKQGGFPGIINRIDVLNQAAKFGHQVLVLTDLDKHPCPVAYREWWENDKHLVRHSNLIFRIAVREVEAWALADAKGFASFFFVSEKNITSNPESIIDPKQYLLDLLKTSKNRDVRDGCLPEAHFVGRTGIEYNDYLRSYFLNSWSPSRAAKNSTSLKRAMNRLLDWQ